LELDVASCNTSTPLEGLREARKSLNRMIKEDG
jgi:hypothetical protein